VQQSSVTSSAPRATRRHAWAPRTVAALFGLSGVVHLVRPQVFEPLIPAWLPEPTAVVYVSGVAELVCAYGLLTRRRWGGPASAALLLAVWPGNWQMAIDATNENGWTSTEALITWARLPLQIPLIWMALQDRPTRPVEDEGDQPSSQRTPSQ
jgi:uncharacterized membrane protein